MAETEFEQALHDRLGVLTRTLEDMVRNDGDPGEIALFESMIDDLRRLGRETSSA